MADGAISVDARFGRMVVALTWVSPSIRPLRLSMSMLSVVMLCMTAFSFLQYFAPVAVQTMKKRKRGERVLSGGSHHVLQSRSHMSGM